LQRGASRSGLRRCRATQYATTHCHRCRSQRLIARWRPAETAAGYDSTHAEIADARDSTVLTHERVAETITEAESDEIP
jgi:hypothetical protein